VPKKGFGLTGHFKIPANPTPEGRICFCIELPDEAEHLAVFWGQLELLGKRWMWGEPLTEASETVAAYWAQIVADNLKSFEESL